MQILKLFLFPGYSNFPDVPYHKHKKTLEKTELKSLCVHITSVSNINKMFDRKRNNDNNDMVKVEIWSPVYWIPVLLS